MQHAMMLVAGSHVGDQPLSGWVLDPAPALSVAFGPITAPGVPAVGLRELRRDELRAFFAVKVEVTVID